MKKHWLYHQVTKLYHKIICSLWRCGHDVSDTVMIMWSFKKNKKSHQEKCAGLQLQIFSLLALHYGICRYLPISQYFIAFVFYSAMHYDSNIDMFNFTLAVIFPVILQLSYEFHCCSFILPLSFSCPGINPLSHYYSKIWF